MTKKLILSLCICTVVSLSASVCDTAYQDAVSYSNLANNYNLNTKESACKMADNLEQVVNNMGTLKANSCSQFNASTFKIILRCLYSLLKNTIISSKLIII